MAYIMHFIAGLGFATIGYCGRGICEHPRHQVGMTCALCAVETVVVVSVIG